MFSEPKSIPKYSCLFYFTLFLYQIKEKEESGMALFLDVSLKTVLLILCFFFGSRFLFQNQVPDDTENPSSSS